MDLFTPGTGVPAEQIHDMNPGVLLNGLFWTTELPAGSFRVSGGGTRARLSVKGVALANTLVFAGDRAIASSVDVDVEWRAIGPRETRGLGTTVPPEDQGAFLGLFSEAHCSGTVSGRQTGFSFETGTLTSDTFYAQMGPQRNGVFL